MPFTNITKNKFLDAFHGKTTYTAPASVWIGLSTTTPTATGTNVTEPPGGSYARVPVPAASWAVASLGSSANTVAINFPTPTASWGTVTYFVVYDALTAGNLLAFDDLPVAQDVPANIALTIAIGGATDAIS